MVLGIDANSALPSSGMTKQSHTSFLWTLAAYLPFLQKLISAVQQCFFRSNTPVIPDATISLQGKVEIVDSSEAEDDMTDQPFNGLFLLMQAYQATPKAL